MGGKRRLFAPLVALVPGNLLRVLTGDDAFGHSRQHLDIGGLAHGLPAGLPGWLVQRRPAGCYVAPGTRNFTHPPSIGYRSVIWMQMGILDVEADDLATLGDADLRTLVGKLAEAEVRKAGYPVSFVTWGGSQDAADGGVDVRVELPHGSVIGGYVPRPATVFQVKKPDLAASAILKEMCPDGRPRPFIEELDASCGAYVIVSPGASLTDGALTRRRQAMRAACPSAGSVHVDFYDRRRLASWVGEYPGITAWVAERTGRPMHGWRGWGRWTNVLPADPDHYLVDEGVRFHYGDSSPAEGKGEADALAGLGYIRGRLGSRDQAVRLVGLSGVGKTRFVQALFDGATGSGALDPASVVYGDAADALDPPAGSMAQVLVDRARPSVLVIDNCPPDLHGHLASTCMRGGGHVALLTVEYDVRDDLPEGTEVIRMEAGSDELVGKLVRARFPNVSFTDVITITRVSEGNARVALSLAGTIGQGGNLTGLSDDQLFDRLFRQRNAPNDDLLLIAQSFALFYSFHCGSPPDAADELGSIGELSGMARPRLTRALGELGRRQLVQSRGPWRAVLPHAVANRLARRALQDVTVEALEDQVLRPGAGRMLRSLTRRLGYLHDSGQATCLARRWLAQGGLLGHPTSLAPTGWELFENIAPADPAATLAALERSTPPEFASSFGRNKSGRVRASRLLRHLAYDAQLFERAAALLVGLALLEAPDERNDSVADVLTSLFTVAGSGTHASLDQRHGFIAGLLEDPDARRRQLGVAALEKALRPRGFGPSMDPAFGARSRDHGRRPATNHEFQGWLERFYGFAADMASSDHVSSAEIREALGRAFPQLWRVPSLRSSLQAGALRIAGAGFWEQGWRACRTLLWQAAWEREKGKAKGDLIQAREVAELEAQLAPVSLRDRMEAYVLANGSPSMADPTKVETMTTAHAEGEAEAERIGRQVAAGDDRETCMAMLFPSPASTGAKTGRSWAFGCGLMRETSDPGGLWSELRVLLASNGMSESGLGVVQGCLHAANRTWPEQVSNWLEHALADPVLGPYLPTLQVAAVLDAPGRARIELSVGTGLTAASAYSFLSHGNVPMLFPADQLARLVAGVASMPDGYAVAVDLLGMRLYGERAEHGNPTLEGQLIQCGRQLLRDAWKPARSRDMLDHHLGELATACLTGSDEDTGNAAREVCRTQFGLGMGLVGLVHERPTLAAALFSVQPHVALDELLRPEGEVPGQRSPERLWDGLADDRATPLASISDEVMVAWCEADPATNYPALASCITFALHIPGGDALAWTDLARTMMTRAPDPTAVLRRFVSRFEPMSFGGALAPIIEQRSRLLDDGWLQGNPVLAAAAREEQGHLMALMATARQGDAATSHRRDQSFE